MPPRRRNRVIPPDIQTWPLDEQLRWWARQLGGKDGRASPMLRPLVLALEEAGTEIEMGRRHVARVARLRGEPDTRRIAPE